MRPLNYEYITVQTMIVLLSLSSFFFRFISITGKLNN